MADPSAYAQWIVQNAHKRGTPEFDTVSRAYQASKQPHSDDAFDQRVREEGGRSESGVENFMAGMGKSVYDTGRGLGQLVGAVSTDDVRASRERDAPLMDTGAGLAGNITGHVGMALAPGGALKAAGVGARALGAGNAAKTLSAMGSSALAPNTIKGAIGVGGAMGLVQPAENIGERVANTGINAIAGGIVPAAGRAYNVTKAAIQPTYKEGQEHILAKMLRKVTGPEAGAVAQRLDEAGSQFVGPTQPGMSQRTMGEIVPGWQPTAAQAGDNAGLAAMSRTVNQIMPEAMNRSTATATTQQQALVNSLRDMAGTDGERAFAGANRSGTANQLYDQAYDLGVDLSKMSPARKGEVSKLLATPAIQKAVNEARTLAKNEMVNLKNPAGSVKGLDYVKRALDDQIGAASGNEQRVLTALKHRLLTTIDTLSPEYAAARSVFQDMSKPLNQMDVAQDVLGKSVRESHMGERLMPESFKRALSDDTAVRATGFGKATLANTMTAQQLRKLDKIKEALNREQFAQTAGKSGSDTVQKLAMSNLLSETGVEHLPSLLSRPMMLANYGMNRIYGAADREMQQRLAETLSDPKATAALLRKLPSSPKAAQIAELLRKTATPAMLAAPGALNADQ